MVLGILFFILRNAQIRFVEYKLVWKTYSTAGAFFITRKVEIIGEKKYASTALNKKDETFVVYMTALNIIDLNIHPSQKARISLLDVKKITIPFKYANYTNIFSLDSMVELLEYISINNHSIDLINNKQSPYSLIYSLEPVELEILKIYIETNLVNSFIR